MVTYDTKRLLIVDDFENFRLSLKRMLNSIGIHDIDIVSNGRDAVRLCREKTYDAILCDYNLGQGKNGQQVLEELQHLDILTRKTLFIMISAETNREMVLGALEYSPDGYISKPFTQALLHKRLESFFSKQDELAPILSALDQHNDQQALQLCQQKANQPGRYRSWCLQQLAELQIKTGDYPGAKLTCDELLKGRQQDLPRLLLAQVAMHEKRFEDAITLLEELLIKSPHLARACDLMAECHRALMAPRAAQKALERAISISPHYLERQQSLANLSQKNEDLDTATEAWRSTVRLSQHSCLEAPDHYLNLARCLGESAGGNSESGSRLAREAMQMVDRARQRFGDSPQIQMESAIVEAQVHINQNNTEDADKALQEAGELLEQLPSDRRESLQLELGKTLLQAGSNERGEQLLNELVVDNNNSELTSLVNEILDEPVSNIQRKRAAELNKKGIEAFKADSFDEAIDYFLDAQTLSGRHPGINLNLIQSILKKARLDGFRKEYEKQCQTALQRIAHLTANHHQWERYQHLKQQVDKQFPEKTDR
ncbi:response regulator [Aestuariirhabdus sp. Z084]|uniref:tetratricopeptide repeat-containing response regulator n=1 Tax=Aestuariirhabdus haliotis TaxID=2918751 RepID=UPI00201B40D7|nr:tetratricopeptide repeat-containing response regulator [Aestuariirhabdus haliotis]MCL6415678.1 response regulator [Aestuariirhabdus haliotis]MCL6419796.1 response regulator [Aestuariirhabdus haliotis]